MVMKMPVSKEIAICRRCGLESNMTRDHVVPQWFMLYTTYFGTSHGEICRKAGLGTYMQRKMCAPCNFAKDGNIEFDDPDVRQYMRAFIEIIQGKMDTIDRPRFLPVDCGCEKSPVVVTPEPAAIAPIAAAIVDIRPGESANAGNFTPNHRHWRGKCWCGHQNVLSQFKDFQRKHEEKS